jgi:hypothetical protein
VLFEVGAHNDILSDDGHDAVDGGAPALGMAADEEGCQQYAQYYFSHISFILPHFKKRAKIQKKEDQRLLFPTIIPSRADYFLPRLSSDTVSFFLPFALRAASTRRPFAVDILSRKPCLCLRLVFEGWYVLFISQLFFILDFFGRQKYTFFPYKHVPVDNFF